MFLLLPCQSLDNVPSELVCQVKITMVPENRVQFPCTYLPLLLSETPRVTLLGGLVPAMSLG